MDDAADVAGDLFDTWLPDAVRKFLAAPFDGDSAAARRALTLLAGLHDLGKATPAFAMQVGRLAEAMREQGLDMPPSKAMLSDRHLVPHAVASHHLFRRWLTERGWSPQRATPWAVILGGHHGSPPDSALLQNALPARLPNLYGQGLWSDVQTELIDRMVLRTGAADHMAEWAEIKLQQTFQVLATGVVILADWIASNPLLHPLTGSDQPDVVAAATPSRSAVHQLGLPPPWRPHGVTGRVEEFFTARFRLPENAVPRPVQVAACEVAESMRDPGLVIIEAPMGEGKTEAALAAAEIMARRWGAGGLQVALPTQATTDAMFDRIVAWLDAMGADGQQVGAVTLSHGKARFNKLFQGLVAAGRPVDVGCDAYEAGASDVAGHAVVAHSWLAGRKKAQLANFVVGTIDQLLFAGLKSRHLMLRHLALAGKVVVIDEVHAYDVFMNSYLVKVLTWLGAYGVPVLALSATLPPDRRQALLDAYQRGRAIAAGGAGGHESDGHESDGRHDSSGYPLISWTEDARCACRDVAPSARRTTVSVGALDGGVDEDADALIGLLEERLSEGGCALVVRNTVARVLQTADALEAAFPGEVSVAHSRFIAADRMRIDAELLRRFGPPVPGAPRPHRHIVVASQVVEQSLDVDFDILVTDLAPVDLVLQRMGRLHRHQRGVDQAERPSKLRSAQVFITGVDLTQEPPVLERAAAQHIYGAYPLLRSAAVLRDRLGGRLELPADIAPLVRAAYGSERIEPESWCETVAEAERTWRAEIDRRTANARAFQVADPFRSGRAILGWVSGSVGETDDAAQGQGQVRDGEPSLEVILVQHDGAGRWHTPGWLPADEAMLDLPRDEAPADAVAAVLASCTVRLPVTLSRNEIEQKLRSQTPKSWATSPLLHRLPVVAVDHDGRGVIDDRPVRYTPQRGLEVLSP